MKKALLFLLLCLSISATAQIPANYGFNGTEPIPCPFDADVTIQSPPHWLAYQTLNGKWNGTIDSSRCISFRDTIFGAIVDLDQIDPSKPLFVKNLLEDKPWLEPDWLFSTHGNITLSSGLELRTSNQCANHFCSGIITGVEVPDEAGMGTNLRLYKNKMYGEPSYGYDVGGCLPTEGFGDNHLSKFIFKISFETADLTGHYIYFRSGFLDMLHEVGHVYDIVAQDWHFNGQSYDLYSWGDLSQDGWFNYLLMHGGDDYPSRAHPYFVEARPEPNSTEQEEINIFFEIEDESFVHQPFTYLRGALVEGSDNVRHRVTLHNHGANFCLPGWIEVVLEEDVSYRHEAGTVELGGPESCMMFRKGSKLSVAEGARFDYGQSGIGILALQAGSKFELEKNASFFIDNMVHIFEGDEASEPGQIYIDLLPGTTFTFGENAQVINKNSFDGSIALNFRMLGGTLDDSRLDVDSRKLVRRIYPEASENFVDNFSAFPNPASENLNICYTASEDENVNFQFFDAFGKEVFSEDFQAGKGGNQFELPLSKFQSGMYFLKFAAAGEWITQKIIIL